MYLYILYGINSNKYYIGITDNPKRRLHEHNSPSKHFTGKSNEKWKLVFVQYFEHKSDARKEEIRLKKAKNKKYLKWYIANKDQ